MRPSRCDAVHRHPRAIAIFGGRPGPLAYTRALTPGQVIRLAHPRIRHHRPKSDRTVVEQPRERYTAQYARADSLPDGGLVDVIKARGRKRARPTYSERRSGSVGGRVVHGVDIMESAGQERT